ncbi:hypothetical protein JCM10049v2_007299 [Rhodotorula toruloides]
MAQRRSSEDADLEMEGLLEEQVAWTGSPNASSLSRKISTASTPLRVFALAGIVFLLGIAVVSVRSSGGSIGKTGRIYIRDGGIGEEGIGSAIQRFKESIILSQALDSHLILTDRPSEHGYSTSDIINRRYLDAAKNVDLSRACNLGDYLPWHRRDELAHGWCAHGPAADPSQVEIAELARQMQHCTVILDARRDEVHEDMNGCLHSWLRDRIGGIPRRSWNARHVTVGVHIRWGDAAGQFRGSMSIENINRLLRDIRDEFGSGNVDVSLVMEQHDSTILRQIDTPRYRLVDSGDSLADMKRLADNNIMLVAESSYAATAHLLAPPGLTIGQIEHPKYHNTTAFGRDFVSLERYTPAWLDKVESLVNGGLLS